MQSRLFRWLVAGYLALIFAGFVALRSSWAMPEGNGLSLERAMFSAINAATLTGFQQTLNVTEYGFTGQMVILILTLGGSLFSLIAGTVAFDAILGLRHSLRRIITWACFAEALLVMLGAVLLVGPRRGVFDAILLAASSLGNSGLYTGQLPSIQQWQTHLVLLPLGVLGGLGLPVLMDLYDWLIERKPLSPYTILVLNLTAGVYLVGSILLLFMQFPEGNLRESALSASVACLNSRTMGLPLGHVYDYTSAMQWLVLMLMVIGAAPAGTAGGLGMITLTDLWRATRGAGPLPLNARFRLADSWAWTYGLIIVIGMTLILWTAPSLQVDPDRLLFILVSAVSSVGLSHDPISFTGLPLYGLMGIMLAGRLAPLLLANHFSRSSTCRG